MVTIATTSSVEVPQTLKSSRRLVNEPHTTEIGWARIIRPSVQLVFLRWCSISPVSRRTQWRISLLHYSEIPAPERWSNFLRPITALMGCDACNRTPKYPSDLIERRWKVFSRLESPHTTGYRKPFPIRIGESPESDSSCSLRLGKGSWSFTKIFFPAMRCSGGVQQSVRWMRHTVRIPVLDDPTWDMTSA